MKDQVLSTGRLVVLDQLVQPPDDAPEQAWIDYKWPHWCEEASVSYRVRGDSIRVPHLLNWERDTERNLEYFDVALEGGFAAPQFTERLLTFLQASQGASGAVTKRLGPNGLRVALSHFYLPEIEPFDPAMIPDSPHRVFLGRLSEGSPLILDFGLTAHALVAGQNGSGKTETDKLILAQLWAKGWDVTIITPTESDSTFEDFDGLDRCRVLCGAADDAIFAVAELLAGEDDDAVAREKERGEASAYSRARGGPSVRVYGEPVPGWEWRSRPSIVFMDETKDFLTGTKDEDGGVLQAKAAIVKYWGRRHRRGRKVDQHCLSSSQQPSVDNIGGGDILNEVGFVLAMRSLRQTFVNVLFPNTASPDVRRVLIDPGTPPGRGVARGAVPPDNEFAGSVDDTAVQIAWADEAQVCGLLGRPSPPAAERFPPARPSPGGNLGGERESPPAPPPPPVERAPVGPVAGAGGPPRWLAVHAVTVALAACVLLVAAVWAAGGAP